MDDTTASSVRMGLVCSAPPLCEDPSEPLHSPLQGSRMHPAPHECLLALQQRLLGSMHRGRCGGRCLGGVCGRGFRSGEVLVALGHHALGSFPQLQHVLPFLMQLPGSLC